MQRCQCRKYCCTQILVGPGAAALELGGADGQQSQRQSSSSSSRTAVAARHTTNNTRRLNTQPPPSPIFPTLSIPTARKQASKHASTEASTNPLPDACCLQLPIYLTTSGPPPHQHRKAVRYNQAITPGSDTLPGEPRPIILTR